MSFEPNPQLDRDPLSAFLPVIRAWFQTRFGRPTPPQAQGWPPIQRGEHALILAPTGSGKTLTAFLWGIDQLSRGLAADEAQREAQNEAKAGNAGVRILYISPLKALNNDIQRNLRQPLREIRRRAEEQGLDFPEIKIAVRSGDTPQRERRTMVRQPPHILITTPESLYLLLTSPKARDLFRTVRTVIVDEIHTLAGNKRGVHLSLSLERLQHLATQQVQRIGLSATIQPLDEVARFLGGNEWHEEDGERCLRPRPVTIVDAAYEKKLDLMVETVVEDFRNLPGDSIWPAIIPRALALIREHKTTLIFTNDRRAAERAADRLNTQIAAEAEGQTSGLIQDGVAKGLGMMAAGTSPDAGPIRVHHGSMSKEARLVLEQALKEGQLSALVGTSSLELGIDIGAIDLVIQLRSPKSVAQGLQRVGRSGHLVGQTSRGRFFPTHREEVIEAAAIAGGMLRGEVEPTHTPRNPLDVLAQQIVAMVSVESWPVDLLFDLVRCAFAYESLTLRTFRAVLEMLAGRYPKQAHRELRARIGWDRVNDKLAELPGSRLLALTNGGTIPDRGAFSAYLADGKTKLGELDEEFVFETRVGDTLLLGSQVWRVTDITDNKLVVAEAPGAVPRMPFWRGDYPWRPYELGRRVGAFRRIVADRLQRLAVDLDLSDYVAIQYRRREPAVEAVVAWLRRDYALDENSAWQVLTYVASQLDKCGAISSDRVVLVEVFDDPLGDPRLVIHSPFGGRVNGPWGLALAGAMRERTGVEVELQTNDDGILLRIPDAETEFPLDIVAELGPAEARERILRELPDSAVFGARFRQNAGRALLLPSLQGGKRTPFWLQRLRAKDLLQVVRQLEEFPIVAETYRDCLDDVLDLPHLETVLAGIQQGEIQLIVVESLTPSPVAQSLLWDFVNIYMYEWDAPKAERQLQSLVLNRDLLQDLLKDVALDELLRPEAIAEIRGRLQHTFPASQARTVEELALLFEQVGDLSSAEIAARSTLDPSGWIARLAGESRIIQVSIPTAHGLQPRWVAAEYAAEYMAAFDLAATETVPETATGTTISPPEARRQILQRFLDRAGPVTQRDIRNRYDFPDDWLSTELERLVEARQLAQGRFTPDQCEQRSDQTDEFIDRRTLEQVHRRTLTLLRREVQPVPFTIYAEFLARWQHLQPQERLSGPGALKQILQQLRAVPVVGRVWEQDVLPLRLVDYDPAELAALCQSGDLVWIGSGGVDPRRSRIRFLFRGEGYNFLEPAPADLSGLELSDSARSIYDFLKSEGAVFAADIRAALELETNIVETALIELVMAGLVTNDSLETMRHIVRGGSSVTRSRKNRPFSSLESQLAERRQRSGGYLGGLRRPSRTRYQSARRRVRQRLEEPNQNASQQVGRWTLIHRFGVMGKVIPPAELAGQQARQLLMRYGLVTRDTLAGEYGCWDWSLIYQELQRLEIRGEIRRGYFIQGLPGIQFALPDAVERLRNIRDMKPEDEANLTIMNACDPANRYGPSTGQPEASFQTAISAPLSFSRLPSTWLVQQRGLPILVAEDTGTSLTTIAGIGEGLVQEALRILFDHLGRFERRVTVERWNGTPVLQSPGRILLEAIGCYRDYPGMTREN